MNRSLTMNYLLRTSFLFFLLLALSTGCSKDPDDSGDELNQNQGEDVQDDSSEQSEDVQDDADISDEEVECTTADDCTKEIPEHAFAICHANHCSWDCEQCESYQRCHLLEDLHPANPCRICSDSGWAELPDDTPCGDDQTCQDGKCS